MKYYAKSDLTALPVFMYHNLVRDNEAAGRYDVSESKFERDMAWLSDNGFTTLTAHELLDYYEGKIKPSNPVLVTFDDGYRSNYEIAYPILRDKGMKATVCVIGVLLDEKRAGYITWDEARTLTESGVIDIQSHSYDLHHEGVDKWPPYGRGISRKKGEDRSKYQDRFNTDTLVMKNRLENIGSSLLLYAYPYGISETWANDILRKNGVKITLLTSNILHRMRGGLYDITRLEVTEDRTIEDIYKNGY